MRLALLVSHEHPLYRLAEAIDWDRFAAELGLLYAGAVGRPGLPTRLMVGICYLKYRLAADLRALRPAGSGAAGALRASPADERGRRETKRLRQYLGRVICNIRRKRPKPTPALRLLLERAERVFKQQRQDSGKLYSVHAPEVECIAKGKAHKPYAFGCKVAVVTTSKSNWGVVISAAHENPYDGATLSPALKQGERVTAVRPQEAFVDRGFKGATRHP